MSRARVIRFLGSTMLVLLITVVLGEISLRILHHFHPLFIFHDDNYNRWRRVPGSWDMDIKVNSHGFKDTEFGPKKSDVYRIIALGDSFVYGNVPYRNNYLTLLEDHLADVRPAEVLNMGIPGIGPRDYLALLVREGLSLSPDAVLVTFFIGNDILQGAGKPEDGGFFERSRLWRAIRYLIWIRPFVEAIPERPGRDAEHFNYCDNCPTFTPSRFLTIETKRAEIFFTNVKNTRSMILDALQPLIEMKEFCRQKQIDFFVVLAPDESQVNPELAALVMKRGYEPYKQYWDPEYPNRIILDHLRSKDIQVLDLLPSFRESGRGQDLYIPRNTHWNIAGNELAGNQIFKWVTEKISLRAPGD